VITRPDLYLEAASAVMVLLFQHHQGILPRLSRHNTWISQLQNNAETSSRGACSYATVCPHELQHRTLDGVRAVQPPACWASERNSL
jgi:hypothetical protein